MTKINDPRYVPGISEIDDDMAYDERDETFGPAPHRIADHYDAIKDLAKVVGMQVIVDAGPNGNVAWFADDVFAHNYLHGGPGDTDGVWVRVVFNEHGEVQEAHKLVNGETKGDVSGTVGNAGQRLLWTLHLFSRR